MLEINQIFRRITACLHQIVHISMGWFDFKRTRTPSKSDTAKKLLRDSKQSKELVEAIQKNHLDQKEVRVGRYRVNRVGQTDA